MEEIVRNIGLYSAYAAATGYGLLAAVQILALLCRLCCVSLMGVDWLVHKTLLRSTS